MTNKDFGQQEIIGNPLFFVIFLPFWGEFTPILGGAVHATAQRLEL